MKKNNLIVVAFIMSFMLNTASLSAQFVTNGPEGGAFPTAIVQKGSTLFCSMRYHLASSTIYRSDDNGANWTNLTNETTPSDIKAIAVLGEYIFIGGSSGIYRSEDNGVTWVEKSAGLPGYQKDIADLTVSGNTILARGIFLMRSDNNGEFWTITNNGLPSEIYIKCLATNNNIFYLGSDEHGIFRSIDFGLTWQEVNDGLAVYYEGEWIPGLFPPMLSIGFSGNDIYLGTDGFQGIWRSQDNGDSWKHVGIETLNFQLIFSVTGDGTNLFAATNGGILRSNNGGSWLPVNNGIDIYVEAKKLLILDGQLFAGTVGGIYATNNAGEYWEPKNNGITSQYLLYRWGFENLIKIDSSIFAGTYYGGVFRSTNEGADWESVNAGLPVNVLDLPMQTALYSSGNTLFTKNYVSTDKGNSWVPCTAPGTIGFDLVSGWIEHGGSLFSIKSGEGSGVFRSDDNGVTWSEKVNGLPYHEGGAFFTIDSDGHTLFIGTAWGLFYSDDNGENWNAGNVPDINAWAFYFANFMSTETTDIYGFFGGGGIRGIYVSDNDGADWTRVSELLVHNFVQGEGIIYVSGTNLEIVNGQEVEVPRILYSLNEGHNWTMMAINNVSTTSITTSGRYLFVATIEPDNSVYVSEDRGATWAQLADGLNSNVIINGLFTTDTKLYATTSGTSVWQRNLSEIYPPEQPDAIVGSIAPCSGSVQTYSVTNVPGVNYNWQLSTGWEILEGEGTNVVTVTVGNTPGVVSVTPSTILGEGPAQFLIVNPVVAPNASVTVTADHQNVCSGTTVTFTATPAEGGDNPSYQWFVNETASGNNLPVFSFVPSNDDRVKVVMTSSLDCVSNSPATSGEITNAVVALPEVNWLVFEPDTLCINWDPVLLSGATPTGGTFSGEGVNNSSFTPSVAGQGSHLITYTYTDANNCSNQISKTIYVNVCQGIEELKDGISIYPNPASDRININIQNDHNIVEIMLINNLGIAVYENKDRKTGGSFSIPVHNIPAGNYFLKITSDKQTMIKTIIVE
jgi:photosystem II stability/assembly factor-like uncharacterized protein